MAQTNYGGVKVISIGGRVARERERLIGMTDDERAWRARFLKSQILAPEEPIIPKDFNKEFYNPIRRFYRAPLNAFENALSSVVGKNPAIVARQLIAKIGFGIAATYCAYYYCKYNSATWYRESGWRIVTSRKATYPGMAGYPNIEQLQPKQYATRGFENSPI